MAKIRTRYRNKAKLYKYFVRDWEHICVFDETALQECYLWETYGQKLTTKNNGYVYGKQWMDVNISMWKEDIEKGLLSKSELGDLSYLLD